MIPPLRAIARYSTLIAWIILIASPSILDNPIALLIAIGAVLALMTSEFSAASRFRRNLSILLLPLAMGALLLFASSQSSLPPLAIGLCSTFALFFIVLLSPHPNALSQDRNEQKCVYAPLSNHARGEDRIRSFHHSALFSNPDFPTYHTLPSLRFGIFYALWIGGSFMVAFSPSSNSASILIVWNCLMLLSANAAIWPFAQTPEWIGYSERRKCFVPRRYATMRNITLWIAAITATLALISASRF